MPGIQSSTNYSQFKLIGNNRDINRGHLEALRKSFLENGNLTEIQPILVNENMEVIDGQHRYTIAKELGMPIFYMEVSGLRIGDARNMNILHRNWSIDDFASSYAEGGDGNYTRYIKMREDYDLSHSIVLTYIHGAEVKGQNTEFRQGEFSFTPEEEMEARARLEKLVEIQEILPVGRDVAFAYAYLRVMSVPDFDQNRMVDKAQRLGDRFRRYANPAEYMRALEELYNYQHSDASRVRLY